MHIITIEDAKRVLTRVGIFLRHFPRAMQDANHASFPLFLFHLIQSCSSDIALELEVWSNCESTVRLKGVLQAPETI